jgi:hypothetical protein
LATWLGGRDHTTNRLKRKLATEPFDALETRGVLRRAAVKKSYLKTLATALGYDSLESCPVGETCRDPNAWLPALVTHFDARTAQAEMGGTGKKVSAFTIRNTKSELRSFFKLADEHGLLPSPLPPSLLTVTTRTAFEREFKNTSPYKNTHNAERYALRQAEWPPDIQAGWQAYRIACGRRIREATIAGYAKCLETYFGYLLNTRKHQPTWDDLFDAVHLNAFVGWHGERMGRDVSAHGWHVVIGAAAIAKVIKHPRTDEVLVFSRTVELPPAICCFTAGRRPWFRYSKRKMCRGQAVLLQR